MMLVGLAGKARSGKDTAADKLVKALDLHRYAFADPIKRMLEPVFGDNFVSGDRERIDPISGVSYRILAQTLGTGWGRDLVVNDLWIRVAKQRWEDLRQPPEGSDPCRLTLADLHYDGMLITDVRFDNEAEWIRSEGGIVIHVDRPTTEQVGIAGHASEQGVTHIHGDLVIQNHSTLDAYHEALDYLSALLKAPSRNRPTSGIVYEHRME